MTGSFSKQILQEQIYIFDQFKFEYTYRFFLDNYQSVEIRLADGTCQTEKFLVPMYCNYLTERAKKRILDVQTEQIESKVSAERNRSRLARVFQQVEELKSEMEYQQSVALYVPLLDRVANHWQLF